MNLTLIQYAALGGLLLSLYDFYVERKLKQNAKFKAICDLSDKVSCTKTFTSGYATTLGIPNPILGILFYSLVLLLDWYHFDIYVFYAAIAGILFSVHHAYILYAKVKSFCIVCHLIYVVNVVLIISSYLNVY